MLFEDAYAGRAHAFDLVLEAPLGSAFEKADRSELFMLLTDWQPVED